MLVALMIAVLLLLTVAAMAWVERDARATEAWWAEAVKPPKRMTEGLRRKREEANGWTDGGGI